MKQRSRAKVVLTIFGIFMAGAVAGSFATDAWQRHERSRFTARDFSERHFQRMVDYLELTDEQVDRIRPTMSNFAEQIRLVRSESFEEVRGIFTEMNVHLVAELSPEQLIRHRKMMEELRTRFERASKRRGASWSARAEGGPSAGESPESPAPPAEE